MILFVTHLSERLKPQSIPVYLAGVRSLHVASGHDNPLEPGLKLKQTLRGIERRHFKEPSKKLPITFDILCKISQFLNTNSTDDCVCWSAATTAHFLMLRAGEFSLKERERFDPNKHLTIADVNLQTTPEGKEYLTLHIKRSKTDQVGKRIQLYLSHSGHHVCAFCAMKKNLQLQQLRPDFSTSSPLFRLTNGLPLSRRTLMNFVSQLLILIGLNPSQYSGHSFRIGGATSESLAGLTYYEIQLLGRWKSDCYKRYIRSPLNLFLEIPRKLATTASIAYQYANPYKLTDS